MADSNLLESVHGSPGLSGQAPVESELLSDPCDSAELASQPVASVQIAIPVYNEADCLESSVRRLRTYLDDSFPFSASIVVVDNASSDETWAIATRLCAELEAVTAIHLDQKGKGRAVRTAWIASESPVVAYMDVDLSTDLDGLLPLVAPLISGHSQVSIGSRIGRGARVLRGAKREFISRSYNLLLRGALRCRFSDAQCGFKAMRRDAVEPLMDLIKDEHWFFDTELLLQAERCGYRIHEVPVDWIDDPDTRVNIGGVMKEDLRGVWRLARRRFSSDVSRNSLALPQHGTAFDDSGEMIRYASVGLASTLSYLVLFLLLRDTIGVFAANLIAAAVTSIVYTVAHISFTFRARTDRQVRQGIAIGAISFAIGIGLTSATLAATYVLGSTSPTAEGLAVLVGILAASSVRFVLLRGWAYRRHTKSVRTVDQDQGAPAASWDATQAA
jgi:glycosyltransferase involved in cell wall biosynthesis